jgi:hypothetical protein
LAFITDAFFITIIFAGAAERCRAALPARQAAPAADAAAFAAAFQLARALLSVSIAPATPRRFSLRHFDFTDISLLPTLSFRRVCATLAPCPAPASSAQATALRVDAERLMRQRLVYCQNAVYDAAGAPCRRRYGVQVRRYLRRAMPFVFTRLMPRLRPIDFHYYYYSRRLMNSFSSFLNCHDTLAERHYYADRPLFIFSILIRFDATDITDFHYNSRCHCAIAIATLCCVALRDACLRRRLLAISAIFT